MAQTIANGLLASACICLFALALLPIVLTRRTFHVAHALLFASAPYTVLPLDRLLGAYGFSIGIVLGISVAVALGVIIDALIYAPLSFRGAPTLNLFIASLGVYIVGTSVLSMIFGDEARSIRVWGLLESWEIAGARLNIIHLITILSAVVLSVGALVFLRFTLLGQYFRAVANDPYLARVQGLNVERINRYAAAIGSALVGFTGILVASDTNATPGMGMQPLLTALAAVIIGGNRLSGIVLAALLLGMAQHVGVMWLPTQWQDAIVFSILIVALLLKPAGLFGDEAMRETG